MNVCQSGNSYRKNNQHWHSYCNLSRKIASVDRRVGIHMGVCVAVITLLRSTKASVEHRFELPIDIFQCPVNSALEYHEFHCKFYQSFWWNLNLKRQIIERSRENKSHVSKSVSLSDHNRKPRHNRLWTEHHLQLEQNNCSHNVAFVISIAIPSKFVPSHPEHLPQYH